MQYSYQQALNGESFLSKIISMKLLAEKSRLLEYFFVENGFMENFLDQGKILVCGKLLFDQGKMFSYGKLPWSVEKFFDQGKILVCGKLP